MSTILDEAATKPRITADDLRKRSAEVNRKLAHPQEPVLDGRPKVEPSALALDIQKAIVALEKNVDPSKMRIGDHLIFKVSKVGQVGDEDIPYIYADEWIVFRKHQTENAWVLIKEGRTKKRIMPSMVKRAITNDITFEAGRIYFIEFLDQKDLGDGKMFNRGISIAYEDWPQDWMRKRIEAIPKKVPKVRIVPESIDLKLDPIAKGHPVAPTRTAETNASVYETILTTKPVGAFNLTQLGNSERLIARFGRHAVHVTKWGVWLIWDGKRWMIDEGNHYLTFLAKSVIRDIPNEPRLGEEEARDNHAIRSETRGAIEAMIDLAARQHAVATETLDADRYLLNVSNGTLDLRTYNLKPHRQEDLITMMADVEYDEFATCPKWIEMMVKVLPDETSRRHFQKWLGVALTGDISERKFRIDWGQLARNGKSTVYRVLRRMLGDYATTVSFTTFSDKMDGKVRNDLASLFKKRLVIAIESGTDLVLDVNTMKMLTGEEEIRCRFLYKEDFTYYPEYKIFLATNNRPRITDSDNSIWDRAQLVEWPYRFKDEEVVLNYAETTLFAELSGILNWAIEGLKLWRAEGLAAPASIRKSTEEYREREYPLAEFIDEKCLVYKGEPKDTKSLASVFGHLLFEAYESWAFAHFVKRTFGRRKFYELLGLKFAQSVNPYNVVVFHGIRLK